MSQSPADKLCTINSKDVMVFKEASDQTTNHQICLKLKNMLIFLSKTYSLVLKKNQILKLQNLAILRYLCLTAPLLKIIKMGTTIQFSLSN